MKSVSFAILVGILLSSSFVHPWTREASAQQSSVANSKAEQISIVKAAISSRVDQEIAKWKKRDTPATVKTFTLYKLALLDVVGDVLQRKLTKTLSADELSSLKSGLVASTISPFILTYPGQKIDENLIGSIENRMSRIIDLWQGEGKSLTGTLWRSSLEGAVDVALNRRLEPAQKKQARNQIKRIVKELEAEVEKRCPNANKETINLLSSQYLKQGEADLDNVASPGFKVLVAESDWSDFVSRSIARVKDTLTSISERPEQFPQDTAGKCEDLYAVLWASVSSGLAFTPTTQANVPQDFGKRWQSYQAKILDGRQDLNRLSLANSMSVRQAYQDRENIASIIAMGIEIVP